jgi:hypothetical protein
MANPYEFELMNSLANRDQRTPFEHRLFCDLVQRNTERCAKMWEDFVDASFQQELRNASSLLDSDAFWDLYSPVPTLPPTPPAPPMRACGKPQKRKAMRSCGLQGGGPRKRLFER